MNDLCTLRKTRSAFNAKVLRCCQVDCINQDLWMISATALKSFPTLSGGALHLVQQIQCKFPVSSSVQGYAASNQWGHHVTTCENDQSTHKMWMKGLNQWLKDCNFWSGFYEIYVCSKSEKLVEFEPERIHFQVESNQAEWHCITWRICKGQRHWRPEIIPRTMLQCSHGKKAFKANHCPVHRSKGTQSERNDFSTSVNSVVLAALPTNAPFVVTSCLQYPLAKELRMTIWTQSSIILELSRSTAFTRLKMTQSCKKASPKTFLAGAARSTVENSIQLYWSFSASLKKEHGQLPPQQTEHEHWWRKYLQVIQAQTPKMYRFFWNLGLGLHF